MDKKELIENFKSLNPYKSSIVRSPWDESVIDVEEIHGNAFKKIVHSIDRVKRTKEPLIFVLQGEPGSGKSHLLWRIAKNAEQKRFLFVNITPFVTVSGISFLTILESTVSSLQKKHHSLKSKPIDHLAGWVIIKGLEGYAPSGKAKKYAFTIDAIMKNRNVLPYVAKETFKTVPKDVQKLLSGVIAKNLIAKHENLPRYFVRILASLLDEETYGIATSFLKGEKLTEDEARKIGLPKNFSLNEEVAFKILYSLFNISPFPFIISIDQIETLDAHLSESEIKRFFEKIVALFAKSGNVMFLLSVQTQTFKKWESFLPEHIKQRLSERTTIYPITLNDAKEIIKARNKYYFAKMGTLPEDPFFPFNEKDIEGIYFQGNRNPRRLIKAADALLKTGAVKKTPLPEIPDMFKRYIPTNDTEKAKYEIPDLFSKTFGAKVLKRTTTYFIIETNGKIFALNNSKHSYWSCVKRMSGFLKKKHAKGAVFMRSEKLKIKKSSVKTMELIRENKIFIYYCKEEVIKELVALSKLLRDTESGDTELEIKNVKKFAERKIKELVPPLFSENKNAETESSEKGEEKIMEFLSDSMISTLQKVAKNTGIKEKKALELLKSLQKKGKVRLKIHARGTIWVIKNEN